jgi:hypothetical protein
MFVLRRLSSALPTLFAVSLLVFLFVDLIPGDPAQILAGPTASNEEIESIRKFLGLNEPLLSRYGQFLRGIFDPAVATSFRTHRPVVVELAERLPNTLIVSIGGLAIGVIVGTLAGIVCAMRPGGIADALITVLTLAGISMPIYWLGLLCIWYFAVNLGWLPAAGASTPMHFVLPILVIATRPAAMFSRLVATSLTESDGQGLSRHRPRQGAERDARRAVPCPAQFADRGGQRRRRPVRRHARRLGRHGDGLRHSRRRPPAGRCGLARRLSGHPVRDPDVRGLLRGDQPRHRSADAMARSPHARPGEARMSLVQDMVAVAPAVRRKHTRQAQQRWTLLRRILVQPKGASA